MAVTAQTASPEYNRPSQKGTTIMGAIPPKPPPVQLTEQQRSEAEFNQQLTRMMGQQPPGRTETWIRAGLLVSVIAWIVWSAGQMSEVVRAWLQ
jgi:hypothetical protein